VDFGTFFSRKKTKQTPDEHSSSAPPKNAMELAIAQIEQEPLTEQEFGSNVTNNQIEVTEIKSKLLPGTEDVAMLYANNKVDAAAALLQTLLQQNPEEDFLWMMLFELYVATQQVDAFEQLSMDYVLKREKSPPTMFADRLQTTRAKPDTKKQPDDAQLFSLNGVLDHNMDERIQLMVKSAASGQIQLDLSGINSVTPDGCNMLRQALIQFQKHHVLVKLASGAFVAQLKALIANKQASEPEYWLLLLQLYQINGKTAAFEDLAIEYAMLFEVSPPSWEAPKKVAQDITTTQQAESGSFVDRRANTNVFAFQGVMDAQAVTQLDAFKTFASPLTEVVLNLANVPRIDFSCVGILMDTLIQLLSKGKKVTIILSNILVYVFLINTGIDQIATVIKDKRGRSA
jgi:anti-anti-sigma regulatory factor